MSQESISGSDDSVFGEMAALLLALLAKEVGPTKLAELGIRAASVAGLFDLDDGIYTAEMKFKDSELQKRMATCIATILASREVLDSTMMTTKDGKVMNLDELSSRMAENILGNPWFPDAETWQGLRDNVSELLGYKSWTDMMNEEARKGTI